MEMEIMYTQDNAVRVLADITSAENTAPVMTMTMFDILVRAAEAAEHFSDQCGDFYNRRMTAYKKGVLKLEDTFAAREAAIAAGRAAEDARWAAIKAAVFIDG